jgi:hypothetical protein
MIRARQRTGRRALVEKVLEDMASHHHGVAVHGERISGGFILITGLDGIRYAVRPQSVGIIHDADECHDETLVQLRLCS